MSAVSSIRTYLHEDLLYERGQLLQVAQHGVEKWVDLIEATWALLLCLRQMLLDVDRLTVRDHSEQVHKASEKALAISLRDLDVGLDPGIRRKAYKEIVTELLLRPTKMRPRNSKNQKSERRQA